MEVSIVVRFRNEAPYLPTVMEALVQQDFPRDSYEIIGVDNSSTDNSRSIVSQFTDRVLNISEYLPGKALNQAIRHARGKAIALISAHAIPANRNWLKTLHSQLERPQVAGVYGAQLYPANSRFLDKRDLDIFSTVEPRVEKENSDFWNANSMIDRRKWELRAFDERTLELEDHHWTKQLLPLGYEIRFEPGALVYHYGHINRVDREYRPAGQLPEKSLIDTAIYELENETEWSVLMMAALTLSGLADSPLIKPAIPALASHLLTHEDFDVRWRMAQVLGKIRDAESVDYLVAALADPSFYPRDEAAWALARLGDLAAEKILAHIDQFTGDAIPFVALALGRSGAKEAERQAVNLLFAEIESGDTIHQIHAIYFAGEIVSASNSQRLIPAINDLLHSEDHRLQAVCCWALGCFAQGFHQAVDWKKIELISRDHAVALTRFEAVVAIGKLALVEPDSALDVLLDRLSDQESRVRFGAMQSIRLLVEQRKDMHRRIRLGDFRDSDFGVMFELGLVRKHDESYSAL